MVGVDLGLLGWVFLYYKKIIGGLVQSMIGRLTTVGGSIEHEIDWEQEPGGRHSPM
jgi:hypothetical protein